ncbi:DUF2714 domain-containing protein [Mycoplasmoides gallisepticum]|uniref:DUF2714 domain-containing protein n=2 Tax=Mycoplasmoides gallisepticum TaxID=2096 RepID=Q7NAJ9_MYCGA|nr:DUF2714 domain-containing protein [Mycoplasmoides gallisepticum]AAP57001.2 conserved hypothetical protein [Mycoplasmoides gallisepticum str. R(low)]ADC30870.1 conserved hypothetical protein [Mycoplasmoides gallisepticum str. R(high)]ADC31625.1 conserved hypothetical protein [Mycoplasmoides gallisepticum str. F]AFP76215.1 hypothetical protein HFMG94VAA_5038 [Mycoplasmoides gallisepticum VA94_7994-1-7P]AFP76982.1 hypothetical protein HFMG95NCA_4966 [Mycoplasmoides gallisepticum NC95_13295-2-2
MKNKNKNNTVQEEIIETSYPSLVQHEDFVEFSQLFNTALLQTNTDESSPQAKLFIEKLKQAVANHLQIVFDSFIISWTKNIRFSFTKLIPAVTTVESSQTDGVNLRSDLTENKHLKLLAERFNLLMNHQLFDEHKIVEVVDGIIVYRSKETNQLKVVFSKEIINA